MDRWMNNNNNEIKSPRAAKPPNFQKKKRMAGAKLSVGHYYIRITRR